MRARNSAIVVRQREIPFLTVLRWKYCNEHIQHISLCTHSSVRVCQFSICDQHQHERGRKKRKIELLLLNLNSTFPSTSVFRLSYPGESTFATLTCHGFKLMYYYRCRKINQIHCKMKDKRRKQMRRADYANGKQVRRTRWGKEIKLNRKSLGDRNRLILLT